MSYAKSHLLKETGPAHLDVSAECQEPASARGEGKRSLMSGLILKMYGRSRHDRIRVPLRRMSVRLEGGQYYSVTIRDIFRKFHGVDIGLYTYGPPLASPDYLRRP